MIQYKVELHPHAEKQLERLNKADYSAIYKELLKLKDDPRFHGTLKLNKNIYRTRVGNWRIIYAIFDKTVVVVILEILRRNERTYKNY